MPGIFTHDNPANNGRAYLAGSEFPAQLIEFSPYKDNPLFSGSGTATWDHKIRERGCILHKSDTYQFWYTGYQDRVNQIKQPVCTDCGGRFH